MKSHTGARLSRLILLLAVSVAFYPAAPNSDHRGIEDRRGIEIEKVDAESPAERAGILAGDVIQQWSSAKGSGLVNSPFDLAFVEAEQAPLGEVVLSGEHAGRAKQWTIEPELWGLTVRPIIPPGYEAEFAAGHIETLAEKVRAEDKVLAAWLFARAARTFDAQNNWSAARSAYNRGVDLLQDIPRVLLLLEAAEKADGHQDDAYMLSRGRSAESLLASLAPKSLTQVRCWNLLGNIERLHGDAKQAKVHLTQALTEARSIAPQCLQCARALHRLSQIAIDRDQLDEAEVYAEEAFSIVRRHAYNSADSASDLNSLALIRFGRGDLAGAEGALKEGLSIRQRLEFRGPIYGKAELLNNLAIVEMNRGKLDEAEQHILQSLAIYREMSVSPVQTADGLANLGWLAESRGDYAQAEVLYRRCISIQKRAGPGSEFAIADNTAALGEIALQRHELAKAEAVYRRSLKIEQHLAPRGFHTAILLGNLGTVLGERGEYAKAESYFDSGLKILRTSSPESKYTADLLCEFADVEKHRGNWHKSQILFERCRAIAHRVLLDSEEEYGALYELAKIAKRSGNFPQAEQYFEEAVSLLESHTARLGGGEESKARYTAERSAYYKDYIDFLLTLRQPEKAFLVLERSRARSFLRMLAERDLTFPGEIPEELRKQQALNAHAYEQAQGEWTKLKSALGSRADAIAKRMHDLEAERVTIQNQIKQSSPRVASLRYPMPLSVAEASDTLDAGTILLSYSVAANHTILFVLPAGGKLATFTIPLAERSLRARIVAFRRRIENRGSVVELRCEAQSLYGDLLKPAESLIASASRILIVPDGPLHILPFAALMRRDEFLAEWKPLHTAMSATVYAQIKATRKLAQDMPETLVAFANPQLPIGAEALAPVARARTERGLPLTPLPYSRAEVETIAQTYSGKATLYLGSEATEERAKQLTEAKYIHFATHGALDERFPLNSALVLTMPERPSEDREDGMLDAWEIIESVRWNADLVVLSACRTALGKEVAAEGLVGLTRAIQFAGAHSVLASLWSVEDRHTAQFMECFYYHLKDQRKDEALRAAQIDMLKTAGGASPFYWAAFTLNGDWQ